MGAPTVRCPSASASMGSPTSRSSRPVTVPSLPASVVWRAWELATSTIEVHGERRGTGRRLAGAGSRPLSSWSPATSGTDRMEVGEIPEDLETVTLEDRLAALVGKPVAGVRRWPPIRSTSR